MYTKIKNKIIATIITAVSMTISGNVNVSAQDFSENSKAKSWNLYAEIPATFSAKVVDILCEITKECENKCNGTRQIGLIREIDNKLIFPLKNNQPAFSGATVDLAPYCDKVVEVDGLILEDPDLNATNIYQVQKIKIKGDEKWKKASQFTKVWAKNNPEAKGKGPWFRRDPRIKQLIDKDGWFGLGKEQDAKYFKENPE